MVCTQVRTFYSWRPADDDIPDEIKTLQERIEAEKEVCATLLMHGILDRNQLSKEMIQAEKEVCKTLHFLFSESSFNSVQSFICSFLPLF